MLKHVVRIFSLNDPGWGRGPGGSDRPPPRPSGEGPPDLDELWRDFNRRLNGLFGRRGGGGATPPGSGGSGMRAAGAGLVLVLAVALLLWLASGFFIVQEGQVAAVMQFGEFRYLNERAGLTWRIPYPVQSHELVNVQQLRQIEVGYRGNVKNKALKESLMLTQDQSIVDMQFAVQYRIADARAWLFNNNVGPVPDEMIRQAAETALREVVGQRGVDQVLYEEKEAVAKDSLHLMQAILDRYQAGLSVVDVTIQQAQPPEQVQAAFEDANKAAQDRERLINEGRAYANDVIPKASGSAARLLQEAEGYKQRTIDTAQGDASRFKLVLTEYAKAPQVTRDRLYIETMQQIYANVAKVYVDAKSQGSLLYLPLDKLIQSGGNAEAARAAAAAAPVSPGPGAAGERSSEPAAAENRSSSPRDALRARDRDIR
jgi:modulator of FtsH protease HflK